MSFYFIKTPRLLQHFFKKYVWSFSLPKASQKTIYLTFDDGPTAEITFWTLNVLKEFNAKATFFCIGKNVENHATIFKQLLAEGHAIGNHTYNHLKGWKVNTGDYIENVLKTEDSLQYSIFSHQSSVSNHQSQTPINQQSSINNYQLTTNLFRPPYGKIKSSQAKQLIKKGYKIVMWDVLSADFDQSISSKKCLDNVLKNTENGSIIVFHDSVKAEKHLKFVLPKVLKYFSEKGYQFSSIALPN